MFKALPVLSYNYNVRRNQLILSGQEVKVQFSHLDMEYYEIIVRKHIDQKRASYFEGMNIKLLPEGDTLIAGQIMDQAELHSILNRIRDMGLTLISVQKKD